MRLLSQRLKGFSFVEILIVTSLIGLMTGMGVTIVPAQIQKAQDTRRKEDVNRFKVAFEEYFNERGCYPTTQEWEAAACGSATSFLSSQFTQFPCDPVTKTKYTYQTTNVDGSVCEGSCGECSGYRLLTRLSNTQDAAISSAGCDAQGCGVNVSPGNNPNWGIAMGSVVPVPGFIPNRTPTTTQTTSLCQKLEAECEINNSQKACCEGLTCVPNNPLSGNGKCQIIAPSPTPNTECKPTGQPPSPHICPAPVAVDRTCTGQLLTNNSFEIDANSDQLPDGWDPLLNYLKVIRPDEGVNCTDAFDGNCSYAFLPWSSPWSPSKTPVLQQTVNISGSSGTPITVSGYVKSSVTQGNSNQVDLFVSLLKNAVSIKTFYLTFYNLINSVWTYGTYTTVAPDSFDAIRLSGQLGPGNNGMKLDTVCLSTSIPISPTPTPDPSDCAGQLLSNGSFENPSAASDQLAQSWGLEGSDNSHASNMYPSEGRNCKYSTDGTYSYRLYPLYYPTTTALHQREIWQYTPVIGAAGSTVTLTFDVKLAENSSCPLIHSATAYIELSLIPTDGLPGAESVIYPYKNINNYSWNTKSISIKTTRPYRVARVIIRNPDFPQEVDLDNLCLKKQ